MVTKIEHRSRTPRQGNRTVRIRAQAPPEVVEMPKLEPSRIKTDGKGLIEISADVRATVPVNQRGTQEGTSLSTYMRLSPEFVCGLDLPLGAKLQRCSDTGYLISLPRMDILDVWVQPTATAVTTSQEGMIAIKSNTATIVGSEQVESLGLTERYDCDADIKWSSAGQDAIVCNAKLVLHIDMPMPFSMMPKMITQTAGDTALRTTLSLLATDFTKSLAADYDKWASDEDERAKRAAAYWKEW